MARVLVVDDSLQSRRAISRMLESIGSVEIAGYAADGEEGIRKVIALKPDLVTVDLEMPKMDGFTLIRILTARFSVPVIVISALGGADKIFKALELGALDFIPKPVGLKSGDYIKLRQDLEQKILQICNLKSDAEALSWDFDQGGGETSTPSLLAGQYPFDIVAIGASTGGPPALQKIFSSFEKKFPFAIVVSQHMPPGFTAAFAERLDRSSPFDVKEAVDGDMLHPGQILIAPGGRNMLFQISGGHVVARVVKPSASDRYVPSVDVMLESCASIYHSRMIAVILTGMGNDGSHGIRVVKEHGGYVLSESESTAVVYGMPREASATGFVDRVVHLDDIATEILLKGSF